MTDQGRRLRDLHTKGAGNMNLARLAGKEEATMRSRSERFHFQRLAAVLAAAMLLACAATASAATTETFVPTTVHYPGSTSTAARGINDSRDIVGTYFCAAPCVNPQTAEVSTAGMTTMHGFLLRRGRFSVLSTPHYAGDTSSRDPDTMNNGVAPSGEIVGFYLSSGVSYIADQRHTVATTFTFEGDLFTLAWDVNARGDIVGVRGDNAANTVGSAVNPRGFLRTRHGDYRTLEVQGALSTQVFGINNRRDIVGLYTDATGTHGFVYRLKRDNGRDNERD